MDYNWTRALKDTSIFEVKGIKGDTVRVGCSVSLYYEERFYMRTIPIHVEGKSQVLNSSTWLKI
jgi:hypothetical protein